MPQMPLYRQLGCSTIELILNCLSDCLGGVKHKHHDKVNHEICRLTKLLDVEAEINRPCGQIES